MLFSAFPQWFFFYLVLIALKSQAIIIVVVFLIFKKYCIYFPVYGVLPAYVCLCTAHMPGAHTRLYHIPQDQGHGQLCATPLLRGN